MFEWIKNIFSGKIWLGVSKDDAVGSGVYRFTFIDSSVIATVISNLISVGKTYTVSGYSLNIQEVDAASYPGKVILTAQTTKLSGANEAAVGWVRLLPLLMTGIAAAIIFSSIEKIEKLVDTTATRTIQIGIVILLILIVWKFAIRK